MRLARRLLQSLLILGLAWPVAQVAAQSSLDQSTIDQLKQQLNSSRATNQGSTTSGGGINLHQPASTPTISTPTITNDTSGPAGARPEPGRAARPAGHDRASQRARAQRVPGLHLQLHRPAPAAVRLQPVRRRALDLRPGAERAGHARLRHRPGRRAADPRLGPDRHRLPRDGRPQRHDQHPARGLDLGRRHRLQGHHQVRPHRGVAQLPQLRPAGHHGPAALGPGVRGRLRQAPRRLHRELAQHAGERDLRRRRPLDRAARCARSSSSATARSSPRWTCTTCSFPATSRRTPSSCPAT